MTPLVIARIRYYPSDSPKRSFYSSNVKDDYATYIDKGISAGFSYMDYAGNPEKSSGIFNQDGIMTKADKQLLRDKLRTTDNMITPIMSSMIAADTIVVPILEFSFPNSFKAATVTETEVAVRITP